MTREEQNLLIALFARQEVLIDTLVQNIKNRFTLQRAEKNGLDALLASPETVDPEAYAKAVARFRELAKSCGVAVQ